MAGPGARDSTARLAAALQALPAARRYWVAYSGGLDSAVLLHALARTRPHGARLRAVHVNHGLQSDAGAWARECRAACRALGIRLHVMTLVERPGSGVSLEAWARDQRYAALRSLVSRGDVMLTAHHQDDQAETVLLAMLRGSGPHGLSAMPASQSFGAGILARPLLDFTRADLERYARKLGLCWIEDPSNLDDRFNRNFLRVRVMPLLRERWPSAALTLSRAAVRQAEAARLLDRLADAELQQVLGPRPDTLIVEYLTGLETEMRRLVVRRWLARARLPTPSEAHLAELDRMLVVARDRTPSLRWPGAELRRYRGLLYAAPSLRARGDAGIYAFTPAVPLDTTLGRLHAERRRGQGLSAERCRMGAMTVRFRAGGERCTPAGRSHSAPLKKLLQDHGIPPWERSRVPLVYVEDTLAAVGGLWVCAPFAAERREAGWVLRWEPGP